MVRSGKLWIHELNILCFMIAMIFSTLLSTAVVMTYNVKIIPYGFPFYIIGSLLELRLYQAIDLDLLAFANIACKYQFGMTPYEYAKSYFIDQCPTDITMNKVHQTITIPYTNGKTRYQIVSPIRAGDIVSIAIDDREDLYAPHEKVITDIYKSLGPFVNFHGIPTTPAMLGVKSIDVEYLTGRINCYTADQVIDIYDI